MNNKDLTSYLCKLTGYTLSTILYVRNFFNENSYSPLDFGPIRLRILKDGSNEAVKNLINYMKNCFRPLKYCYLKTLVMEIHDSFNVIESYDLTYDYSIQLNEDPQQFLRKNDIDLMLNLIETLEQMKSIPKNRHYNVVFKLYYNDIVPIDYEPPGFVPYKSNSSNCSRNLNIYNHVTTHEQSFSIQIKSNEENLKSSDDHENDSSQISNKRSQQLYGNK
ncbi:HORMA domain-containing protein 1 [Dermatophagoides farinae]|uniref:HORMA domain-containing protein n=1 Tax=Dermatophagoides farinae TaxID=6954 RepID=A0A9D4SGN9_DERFA|nr:HORMA domain-containing protein 1-like [Dermatophagoides farinae]KAH7640390.1 hypothetical protein HUG17_7857 [Dermatophagoides farinae]